MRITAWFSSLTVLFLAYLVEYISCGLLSTNGSQSVVGYSSNKSAKTSYQFTFYATNAIASNATVEVIFPLDFVARMPKSPSCFSRVGSTDSFESATCTLSNFRVVRVTMASITTDQTTIVIGEVNNPAQADVSSHFRVRTYYYSVVVDYNDAFGFVSFSAVPLVIQSPSIFKLSNDRISEGSSWEFHFTTVGSYSSGNSFRFSFPDGFTTKQVLCDVANLSGQDPTVSVLYNQRVVTCENIVKAISGKQVVKVVNMKNPSFSGLMQGFSIEILQGTSTVVLEKVDFAGNILISPGQPTISYNSSDSFKESNSTYYFNVNLVNPVTYGDKLFLNFTNEWGLFSPNCTIIDGFELHNKEAVQCSLISNSKSYVVTNFEKISDAMRLVLSVFLQTPDSENVYPVTISTYSSQRNAVVDLNTAIVSINGTYGVLSRFISHTLNQPTKAVAGKAGSLEMTFFLKTELPKSNVDSFGKFRVDIFPQIPIPDSLLYGPVECDFFGETPSANSCADTTTSIFDTDTTRLLIYIYTPEDYSFKQSEVPITVTTSGKDANYYPGFVLDPLVQRYFIHVHTWARSNTGTALPAANTQPDIPTASPTEVYFTEYIPAYREIDGADDPDLVSTTLPNRPTYQKAPNVVITSQGTQAGTDTYVNVLYTHQDTVVKSYTLRAPADRNYILRVYFKSGWATGLGYTLSTTNKIFKNYPCLLKGTIIDSSGTTAYSNCDLYIGTNYPYLQVNNLSTLRFDVGAYVNIGIPRIKIGSTVSSSAICYVEVLEEQPGYWDPTVTVYKSLDRTVFTIIAAPSVTTGSLTFTPTVSTLNAVTTYTLSFAQSTTAIDGIAVYWDSSLPISFNEVTCTKVTAVTCDKFPYPVYWIYVTGAGVSLSTVQILMPTTTSVNVAHEKTLTFSTISFGSVLSRILVKSSTTYYFPPLSMSTYAFFSTVLPASYQFQGFVSPHTIQFTLVEPMPDDWYIQLDFVGGMTVVYDDQFYFVSNSAVVTGLDSRGILMTFNGAQFIIYNLAAASAGDQIDITFSITLPLTSTCTASVTVAAEYAYGSSGQRVNIISSLPHADSPMTLSDSTLLEFEVINPITYKISPTESYIGPFNFNFAPSIALSVGDTLTLRWEKATTGPVAPGFAFQYFTSGTMVPITCKIGTAYSPCTGSEETSYIKVVITLQQAWSAGSSEEIMISTDTAPDQDGIIYPTEGGYYEFRIETTGTSTSYSTQIFIRPEEFTESSIAFAHSTIYKPNIMEFSFITTRSVNSFSNGGRIIIYFPIYDSGTTIYANDLGLGTSPPGCWFGSTFAKEASATSIKCILTAAGSGSGSLLEYYFAKIEVVGFTALTAGTTYTIIIGKIANPGLGSSPFQILVMTYNIDSSTNEKAYRNSALIGLYLNEKSDTSITETSSQSTTFGTGLVQQTSKDITHSIYTSVSLSASDFIVVNLYSSPLGSFLNAGSVLNMGMLNTCDTTKYTYCIAMDDIKWVIWKLATAISSSTAQSAPISLIQLPLHIQRSATTYYSHVIASGKYASYVTETIPISAWTAMILTPSSVSMGLVGTADYYQKSRKKAEIQILFTLTGAITTSGSILVVFSSGYVPYAHCRSMVLQGSTLVSAVGTNSGEIGCYVQSNGWYITGFAAVTAGSSVILQGFVDLPTTAGTFSVYSYDSRDDSTLMTTGNTIDTVTTISGSTVQNVGDYAIDSTMVLLQATPLRVGYVGEFRAAFKSSTALSGTVTFDLDMKTQIGTTTNGFQSLSAVSSYIIAYAIKKSDQSITPFLFSSYVEASSVITITFTLSHGSLTASTEYIIVLTTQYLDTSLTDGIKWPTGIGIYRVRINFVTNSIAYTDYIEVYGPKFTALTVSSTSNGKGLSNLIYVSLKPATAIAASDQIVFEFSTASIDSISLFSSNLGRSTLQGNQVIPSDFVSGVTSGTCYLNYGYTTNGSSARVTCTSFSGAISTSTTAIFFFEIYNPSTPTEDTYIPVFVYTLTPSSTGDFTKKNWQILEQEFLVKSAATLSSATTVTPTRSDTTFGVTSGLTFTFPLAEAASAGDFLIINTDFPGIPTISSSSASLTCTSGTFYLLGTCRKFVCKFTASVSASTNIVFTNTITGSMFYNPSYLLTTAQLQLSAYLSYHSDYTKQTTILPCNAMTQLTSITTTSSSVTVATPIFIHTTTINSYTDIIYEINSVNLNVVYSLKVTHGIVGITLNTAKLECMMASTSAIEIISCYHDGTYFYISINPASVATTKKLVFTTRHQSIKTPSSAASSSFAPVIEFYDSSSNLLFTSNIAATSQTFFASPPSTIVSSAYTPLAEDTFTLNQFRYFDYDLPFPISNSLYSAPLQFTYYAQESQAIGTTISFQFSSLLQAVGSATITQLSSNVEIYKYILVCKMNDVTITTCTFTSATGTLTVTLDSAITSSSPYVFYFTVIAQDTYPSLQGFYWAHTSATTDITARTFTITTPNLNLISDINFFATNRALYTNLIDVTASSITSTHSVVSQPNLLTINLSLTTSGVTALIIEIPTYTAGGTQIFASNTMHSLQTGQIFPCSGGTSTTIPPTCWIEQGEYSSSSTFSKPIRIIIESFSYTAGTAFPIYLMVENPQSAGLALSMTIRAMDALQIQSGYFTVNSVLQSVSYSVTAVAQTITLTDTIYSTSLLYSFPRQMSSALYIYLPLDNCAYVNSGNTQAEMMKYIDVATNTPIQIIFTTSATSPYTTNNFSCQLPASIAYYESATSNDFYSNSGTLSASAATTTQCTTCFTISTASTTFSPLASFTSANGVLALTLTQDISIPTTIDASTPMQMVVTITSAGISITQCGARFGLLSASGASDISSQTACTVDSTTQITLSYFYALRIANEIQIQLIYTSDSTLPSGTPTIDVSLSVNSINLAASTGLTLVSQFVTATDLIASANYKAVRTTTVQELALAVIVNPYTSITMDTVTVGALFTVELTLTNEYQASALFSSIACSASSITVTASSTWLYTVDSCSASSNVLTITFQYTVPGAATTYDPSDNLEFTVTLSTIDLTQSTPSTYISQFFFVNVKAYQTSGVDENTTLMQAILSTSSSTATLAATATAATLTAETSQITEFTFTLNSLNTAITSANGDYLLVELAGASAWPTDLISGVVSATKLAQIDCLCYNTASPSSALSSITCYQHYQQSLASVTLLSLHGITATSSSSLACYIPQVISPSTNSNFDAYINLINGPPASINQSTNLGVLYQNKVTSFEGTSAAISSPSATVTTPTITLGSATSINIAVVAVNPSTYSATNAYVYAIMDIMSPSKYKLLTQATTCSGYNYDTCRVYSLLSNIVVMTASNAASVSIPLDQSTFTEMTYTKQTDLYQFTLFIFDTYQLINTSGSTFQFIAINYPTAAVSTTIDVFPYYEVRKNVRSIFDVDILPSVAGVLAGVSIAPTVSTDFTIYACSAYDATSASAYSCTVTSNVIYVSVNPTLASGSTLSVRIAGASGTISTTLIAFSVAYFSAYTSTTDYTKRGEMTFQLTNSNSAAINSVITAPFIRMSNFSPQVYLISALSSFAPIRVNFYETGDISTGFTSVSVYLKTTTQFEDSSAAFTTTSRNINCYYRIVNSDTFIEYLPAESCSMIYDSGNSYSIITAGNPLGTTLPSSEKIQLIISSRAQTSAPGIRKVGSTSDFISTAILISASTIYYAEHNWIYSLLAVTPTLSKYYYTSTSKALETSMYFELTNMAQSAYPAEYLEIVFDSIGASAFTSYTPTGLPISCEVTNVSNPASLSLTPFCIVNVRDTTKLVVKVLSIDTLSTSSVLKLALDDILLLPTSTTIENLTYSMNLIGQSAAYIPYVKSTRYFSHVFTMTSTVSITPTYPAMNPSSTYFGATGVSLQFASTFANQLSVNSGTVKPSKARIHVSSGYFSMSANTFTPANFYEKTGTAYTILWSNSKLKTLYVETLSTAAIQPLIQSLTNPSLSSKTAFEASPFIEYKFYTNYINTATMQPTIPTLVQVSPYSGYTTSFTITPTSLATSSQVGSTQWLKLTLAFSTTSTIFNSVKTGSSYTAIEIAESTGLSSILECVFVLSTGLLTQTGCEVTGTKTLHIGNLYSATASASWTIFLRAKISSSSFTFAFSFNQMLYNTSTSTWSSLTIWSFSTTSTLTLSGTAPTLAQPSVQKYFNNYYERQITYITPALATVKEANFLFTPDTTLAAAATITATFSTPASPLVDPSTNALFCVLQKQVNTYSYGLGRKTTCTHASGVYTFTIPDNGITVAATTVLFTARYDQSVAATAFTTVASAPFKQYLDVSINSAINVAVIELKNHIKTLAFVNFSHTVSQLDYVQVTLQLTNALAAGTSSTESILYIELASGSYPDNAGLPTLYAYDSRTFVNGQAHDFIGTSSLLSASAIAQTGYSTQSQPFRFAITQFSALAASTSMQIRIPFIQNGAVNKQVMLRIYTVSYPSATPKLATILDDTLYIKNYVFSTATVATCAYSASPIATTYVQQTSNAKIQLQVSSIGSITSSAGILLFIPVSTNSGYDHTSWGLQSLSGVSSIEQFPITHAVALRFSATTSSLNVQGTTFTTTNEQQPFSFSLFYSADTLVTKASCDLHSTTQTFAKYTSAVSGTPTVTVVDSTTTNKYSNSIIKLAFTVRKLPASSTITITVDSKLVLSNHFIHTISRATLVPLSSVSGSSVTLTPTSSSTILTITGFDTITSGTAILITIGVQTLASSSGTASFVYAATGPLGLGIETFTIGSFTINTTSGITSFSTDFQYEQRVKAGNWGPIQIEYLLRNISILYANALSRLELTIPSDFTRASGGTQLLTYQVKDDLYWVDAVKTDFATIPIQIRSPATAFDMTPAYTYTMLVNTKNSASNNNGFLYPSTYGYYLFQLVAYSGATSATEVAYYNYILEPSVDEKLLEFQSISRQAGDFTVLRFKWQLSVAAASGDEIWLEFTSNNGYYADAGTYLNNDKVFANDLGTGSNYSILDCVEASNTSVISSSKLFCDQIILGDDTLIPPNDQKPTVRIKITNAIASGTTIEFFVAGIRNPLYNQRRGVVTVSLRKTPVQAAYADYKKVAYQISVGEYTTTAATSYFDTSSPTSTIVYNTAQPTSIYSTSFAASGVVWDTSTTHTWNIVTNSNFLASDWILVIYTLTNNSNMSKLCAPVSYCYVFPSLGWVIRKVPSNVGNIYVSYTLTLMNNGLYRYGGQFKIAHYLSTGEVIAAYLSNGLTYTYYTTGMSVTIKPTLTPQDSTIIDKYWLTDFMNVAKITITGMWKFNNIKSFWFKKPTQIAYFDTTYRYCNATLIVDATEYNPYPWRFNCYVASTSSLYLEMTSDFDAYSSTVHYVKSIVIYVSMWINEFTSASTTGSFVFYGSALTTASDDQNYGVTYSTGTITISSYVQPDLRDVTFNSVSFKESTASAGDQVEFYMLIEPKTSLSKYQIDKFIFKIPNEYGYAAVKSLDSCSMLGKTSTPITSCELTRSNATTYVTLIPDSTYDNTVKIVELTDSVTSNLFTAPDLPGNIYNITVELYSGTVFLERQTVNITRVLGYEYVKNSVVVDTYLDPLAVGLFYFESQIGTKDVLPGFDSDATTMYTSLEFTFANNDHQFLEDLGTGLQTGDEVPCLGGPEITMNVKKRLTCVITVGTSANDLPTINVFGYDLIKAGTIVRIYFPSIKTLGIGLEANTYTAVRIYYKWVNYSAIYYETTSYASGQPTAAAALTVTTVDATASGSNLVGQTRSYTFSFALSGTLATTDYIFFEFPLNYFDRLGDFSGITCTGFTVQVFAYNNQIYIKPTSAMSGTISITISNLINPAYSQNVVVLIPTTQLQALKAVKKINFRLNNALTSPILPCASFTKIESVCDSNVSGENGAVFTVNFILGHEIPAETGAIGVSLPAAYTYSLNDMGTTCTLSGFDTEATCEIGSPSRTIVYLNGATMESNKQYSIILTNMNTPDTSILPASFTLTSFYSSNVYLGHKICVADFAMPSFQTTSIESCYILVDTAITNANRLSTYTFNLQCDGPVRDNTVIEISLHKDFTATNKLTNTFECFSNESTTLRSSACKFSQKGSLFILSVNVAAIDAMSLFTVQVNLVNPKVVTSTGYTFTANLYSYSVYYATTSTASEAIVLNTAITTSTNPQVTLNNIPKNAGQLSTYTFSIPPLGSTYSTTQVSTVQFTFPDTGDFTLDLGGSDIECGVYLTSTYDVSFLTYSGLLKLTHARSSTTTTTYTSLDCSMIAKYTLSIDTNSKSINSPITQSLTSTTYANTLQGIDSLWQHWIIRNIQNPERYNSTGTFNIQYLLSTSVQWAFSKSLVFQIARAPLYLRVQGINVASNEIRTRSLYSFNVTSQLALPQNPLVGVSIGLPKQLYETVAVHHDIAGPSACTIASLNGSNNSTLACDIYGYEVILEKANFIRLASAYNFTLNIASLANPNINYTCSTTSDINRFDIKLFDWNSNDLLFITSPSIDDLNCLAFNKTKFYANVVGALTVSPGLAYQYTLNLERGAHNMIVTPNASIANSITFNPTSMSLYNYTDTTVSFYIKYRSDINPGTYNIQFDLSSVLSNDTSAISSFLPVLPLQVLVLSLSDALAVTPLVTIGDLKVNSIGYALRVPVTLSAAPANTIYLAMTVVESSTFADIISFSPSVLTIDSETVSTYFEITITTKVVPSVYATVQFSLTSYYTVVHTLTDSVKYLSFAITRSKALNYALLAVTFDRIGVTTAATDAGLFVSVANSSTAVKQLSPKIIVLKTTTTEPNSVSVSVSASQEVTLYLTYALYGNSAPASNDEILSETYTNGLYFNKYEINQSISTIGVVQYTQNIALSSLTAQTNYKLYVYATSALGNSTMYSLSFRTSRTSFGSRVSLPFTAITDVDDIVSGLSQSLQIPSSRIISEVNTTKLDEYVSRADATNTTSSLKLYYDFVIAPNPSDDSVATEIYATRIISDSITRNTFAALLSAFDLYSTVHSTQIIQAIPTVDITPRATVINYSNATFSIRLWEQGYVFAIVRDKYYLDASAPPVSTQIQAGTDEKNQAISSYQVFSALTDENGYASIYVDDLTDGKVYKLYVTVGSNLPYVPTNLMDDDDVIVVEFTTPYNSNLGTYGQGLQTVYLANPDLADAISRYRG